MKEETSKKEVSQVSATVMPTGTTVDPNFWKQNWWKGLLLVIIPFALYWQCTNYDYVLDDQIVITDNSFTKEGWSGIDDLLTTESFTGYFGEQKNLVQGNRYRPLSLITFAIEYGICGELNPWLSHFINILLYGLLGLLIYRIVSSFLPKQNKPWWLALPFLTALLYILHPIHSEAVANIKGRDEIMAMLLSMATLYYVLKSSDVIQKRYTLMGMLLFFLALLAKENSITFLAVIPLTLFFFRNKGIISSLKSTLPYLLVTVVYLTLRFTVAGVPQFGDESPDLMNNAFLGMDNGEKMATIFYTLLKYIQLYIWPHPLSHDYYPYAIPKLNWGTWQAMSGLLVHVGLVAIAILGWKKRSVVSYSILFYLTTLTIVSNVVINLGTFMNERFIFMASLGLILFTTYLITEKLSGKFGAAGKYIAIGLIAFLVAGYTYKTLDRVPDWESALTLNRSAVEGGTNSARANSFMATAIYNEAKTMTPGVEKNELLDQGYKYAVRAIEIHPSYKNANLMLAGMAAELYRNHGSQTRLLEDFKLVALRRPDVSYLIEYLDYLEGRTNNMDELINWYYDIGINLQTKPTFAIQYLNRAYRLSPSNQKVISALANIYGKVGDRGNAQKFQNLIR